MNMHCAAYHCIWTLYNIYIVYIDPLNSVRLYLGEVFLIVFLLEDQWCYFQAYNFLSARCSFLNKNGYSTASWEVF